MQNLVLDVQQDPTKYNAYLKTHPGGTTKSENTVTRQGGSCDNEDDNVDKYFLATWILAGVGILLAVAIVALLVITYRMKAEAYTIEGTKL